MPDIKTRDTVKGTIKTLDKAAVAGERMKEAYVRTKEKAEHGVYSAESSPEEYAADRFSGGTETVTYVEVVERNNELAALRNYTTGAPVVAATTKSLQEGARVRTAG